MRTRIRGRSLPAPRTWKCGLDTHLASCRKRGSIIFTNSDGSITSKISSNSFKNMTSFGLCVFGQYLRSAITTYRRHDTQWDVREGRCELAVLVFVRVAPPPPPTEHPNREVPFSLQKER